MADDNQVSVISEGSSEDSKRRFFTTRNIVILGVIGLGFAILFAVFYYFLFASKLTPNKEEGGLSQKTTIGSTSETIELKALTDSRPSQGGFVTLTEIDGDTSILVELDAILGADEQPINIYKGTCVAPTEEIVYELNKTVNGKSETFVKDDINSIKSNKPLAIVLHKSFEEEKVNVSCADVQ